jgi:hypothetical protein
MALSRIGGRMQHVYGHTDKYLLEAEISPAQRVNCWADKLATAALIAMVEANEFISSIFPSEKVCIEIAGERAGYRVPPKCKRSQEIVLKNKFDYDSHFGQHLRGTLLHAKM